MQAIVNVLAAFVVGRLVGSEVVEDDEAAAPEGVAALQSFAVEPFHFGRQVGGADRFQHSGKLLFYREALTLPVPHFACGCVDDGPPAIDFGFVGPQAALEAIRFEWAAIDRTERIGWDHGEFYLIIRAKCSMSFSFANSRGTGHAPKMLRFSTDTLNVPSSLAWMPRPVFPLCHCQNSTWSDKSLLKYMDM